MGFDIMYLTKMDIGNYFNFAHKGDKGRAFMVSFTAYV